LEQFQALWPQPFFIATPYLLGILLGYVLYRNYNINDLPLKKFLIYAILWFTAIVLSKITLFGTIGEYDGTCPFTELENIAFLMFTGLTWSIGIAIIIYICNTGYGGAVNSILSGIH